MIKNFTLLLLLIFSSSLAHASSYKFPVIAVNGVPHKLIVSGYLEYGIYREAPESADGFCAHSGEHQYNGLVSVLTSEGPFVLLDRSGKVKKTFDNSSENSRRFWIAETLDCN